jgi:hypothetical protein
VADFAFERMRQERVNHHAPRQTDRPNENAAPRARLDNALTSAANDAYGRKAEEGVTTKAKANKNRSVAGRKGENNAAQFVAETAGSPEGINSV